MSNESAYAEGGNYRFELSKGVAMCRVWRRPDVDSKMGARFAEEKVAVSKRLVNEPPLVVRGFVFDLRDAPPVVGPVTQEFIGQILAMWEAAGRRIALVVSDSATQSLQMTRLVNEHAKNQGRACRELSDAIAWASGAPVGSSLRPKTFPGVEARPLGSSDPNATRREK